MPPPVRDLQALIAQQQAGLAPQYDVIAQDIQNAENAGQAQVKGLEATKTQAFGDIEQGAQNKGMYFSGFSPAEQAKYTATTYLPALAQLQATIAQTRSGLLGKKADLGVKAFDVATQQQETDRQILADWQKMTAQQQYQASEAEKERVFTAKQNEADRRVSATNSANSNQLPTTAQFLVSAFSGYDPSKANGYTEREVIPALMANYGISREQAANLAYTYRKQNYNE